MPSAIASAVEWMAACCPSISIVPPSDRSAAGYRRYDAGAGRFAVAEVRGNGNGNGNGNGGGD